MLLRLYQTSELACSFRNTHSAYGIEKKLQEHIVVRLAVILDAPGRSHLPGISDGRDGSVGVVVAGKPMIF